MNAEKGDKCCDITQESLLINRASQGSCLLIEYWGWRRDPLERKDKPSIWATDAGFQGGTDSFLEILVSCLWLPAPQADWLVYVGSRGIRWQEGGLPGDAFKWAEGNLCLTQVTLGMSGRPDMLPFSWPHQF